MDSPTGGCPLENTTDKILSAENLVFADDDESEHCVFTSSHQSLSCQLSPASSTSSFHEYSHLWNENNHHNHKTSLPSMRDAFEKMICEIQQDSPSLARRLMQRRPPALFTSRPPHQHQNQQQSPSTPDGGGRSRFYNVTVAAEPDSETLSAESCEHRTPIEKEPTVMVAWEDEKEDTSDGEAVTAPSAAESNYPVTDAISQDYSSGSEDSRSEDERRQMSSRLQKREDRMRSRADTSAGPANLKRESTIRSSNQTPQRNTGGLVRGRQSTFRRNNVTREKGGGSEDGVSNRLAVQQNNPRAWFNQIKEQSPLLGGRRNRNAVVALRGVTNESSDNASISNSSNRTTHNVDSYVKTCLESPDKQIFPSLNNKSQWNASQPLFPSPVTPPPPPPDEKIMSPEEKAIIKRKNIVNEIYHTEMNYVDFLRRLKDLLDEINAARKKDECYDGLKRVLTRAKAILHAHEHDLKLVSCLERLVMDWSKNEVISTPISAAFSNAEMKQCYANYVLEHSKYQALIKNWRMQNQSFDAYLTAFEEGFPDKLSMESLFLKPIQRLPQLILILQRLLSSCETKHRDRQGLQSAVMSVEQLAHDLNEMKGHHDLTREVDSIREMYCKSHRPGAVDSILPKSDISRCTRKDEVKVTMISPTPSAPMDGVVLLFSRKMLILISKKTDRSERLSAVLMAEIGKVQCIGHEIFFKAGMCDSVDPDLMDEWKGVLEDESRLNALKNEMEKLNREYRDLNPENIQSAIKEHQALSKDVIQSIKAAGCVDVFFSAEPEPTVKDEFMADARGVMAFISQWKLTFPTKDDANAWKITLQMLQLANKCRFVTIRSPSDSGSTEKNRVLEQSVRNGIGSSHSPIASKKISTADDVVGCWVKTDAERNSSSEPLLSVPLLYSTAKVDVDIINRSMSNLIDEENAHIVCSVPLTNAPNICPLSLGPKLNSKSIDKPHAEMLLCYGIVWVVLSSNEAFCIAVYSICESGMVHPLNSSSHDVHASRKVTGGRGQAFCAVAVPGLEVDDSFVEWAKQQLQDAGNESKRPRVLNQQSVWIGTNTGITVYKVSSKSGLGSRVFSLPTEYSVMALAYANGHVVAGLEHGIVNVYTRSSNESSYGAWNRSAAVIHLSDPTTDLVNLSTSPTARTSTVKDDDRQRPTTPGEDDKSSEDDEEVSLGNVVGDVSCIVLPFNDCLKSVADPDQVVDVAWCSAGDNIYIVSILDKKVLFKIQMETPLNTIVSMATVGVCVFVACRNSRHLLMYHAESYRAVSMVNLDKPIAASVKLVPGMNDDSDGGSSGGGGAVGMSSRRTSRDPKKRYQSDLFQKSSPSSRKSSVSSRRGSAFTTDFYPCMVTAHSGNLWVGTSSGHIVRFQISKIGLIPNIREGTRLCIYKFSQPVSSIIFTGRKYQAAHQQVVMSQNPTSNGDTGGNRLNPLSAKKSHKLNTRKVSMAGSQENSFLHASQSMLYLAGNDPDDPDSKADNDDALNPTDEDRQTDSGSFPCDDRANVIDAFPMLAAKKKGAANSNISHSTYVLALGHNFRSMIPPTNQFFEASQVGANIIAYQVM